MEKEPGERTNEVDVLAWRFCYYCGHVFYEASDQCPNCDTGQYTDTEAGIRTALAAIDAAKKGE